MLSRRTFLHAAFAATGTTLLATADAASPGPRRKFTMDLRCGSIGVKADFRGAIELAHKYGFESVEPSATALAAMSDGQIAELRAELKQKSLVWGASGVAVDFRGDEGAFQAGLKRLPASARALQRGGVTRVGTFISPSHDELTYLANFRQHTRRLRQIAAVLDDHGIRFGVEYVGPKTSWTRGRFPFIHTMAEARELIAEIGKNNVGLVLDSWHWYTAHETRSDLLALSGRDVIACHLNDAPQGVAIDDQVDNCRRLPAATGVIDLAAFLGALVTIGYDGPVCAEPFDQALRSLPPEKAVAATAAAMKRAFAVVA